MSECAELSIFCTIKCAALIANIHDTISPANALLLQQVDDGKV